MKSEVARLFVYQQISKGDWFLKKLWCCVIGGVIHENLVYQWSWWCKLTTVQRLKSWRFERSPFVRANLANSRSDEGLTIETSALQSLYGGQFTLSTPLINQMFVYHSSYNYLTWAYFKDRFEVLSSSPRTSLSSTTLIFDYREYQFQSRIIQFE